MLLLTEDGSIIAARDHWGRTPIVIGKKDGAYAATSESTSFPNLDYEIDRYLGPGEIVRMHADHIEQLRKPNEEMQICSFLWLWDMQKEKVCLTIVLSLNIRRHGLVALHQVIRSCARLLQR